MPSFDPHYAGRVFSIFRVGLPYMPQSPLNAVSGNSVTRITVGLPCYGGWGLLHRQSGSRLSGLKASASPQSDG